jgi:hypothetical protein
LLIVVSILVLPPTFRAHESWGLEEPPDYVTFAKKFHSGGFFFRGNEDLEVRDV